MTTLKNSIRTALWNLIHRPDVVDILDILIVAFLIYKLIMLVRQTRSSGTLMGLLVLLIITGVSNLLGLTALNWVLMTVISNGVLVLVVLFQPELRTALEHVGRKFLFGHNTSTKTEEDRVVDEVTQCLLDLSARKVGALIVFERKTALGDVTDTGTALDARISAGLLENIFEPNTPLHDGAVVIRDTRIAAAACILRLSDNTNISRDLGTRHRAAIGVTEVSDAVVLVVSEETGAISTTSAGIIRRRLNEREIRTVLSDLYQSDEGTLMAAIRKRFGRKERAAK